ncbi:class I SAM-dependent methyltransferase [Anaerosinus massiliensis]|uniref:class I SAM-dependent methyltransferase n=1 Tax=Massilibacillus massiliensis TaxID=1806837 RepID=UPI000DA61A84|nr:class I SAM-dependent methyltransferase [Massilibacillus massiliensis]
MNFKIKQILFARNELCNLQKNVIECNSFGEIKRVFKWEEDPVLDRPDIYDFDYIEDINERRIRDAEALAVVMKNVKPKIALEIGTANGMGTVLMAANAPETNIFTINIPPEEILSGAGGNLTTIALEKEKIGIEYKKQNLKNITQIYSNTATWEPNVGNIDVAFIDGCHDTKFVYNDTIKVLRNMKPGGFILWHDFNLELKDKFGWINEVCLAIEKLYKDGYLKGRILHLKDSWIGIYKV